MMRLNACGVLLCLFVVLSGACAPAQADTGGRLPATGGVTSIEAAGGGGLTPWALIAGYGTRDEWAGTVSYTRLPLDAFTFDSMAINVGIADRFEFSLGRQHFDLEQVVPGEALRQHIAGFKWRIAGEAIFSGDALPQLTLGLQYKRNEDFAFIPRALGARREEDVELYLSAGKLYFSALGGRNLYVNAGLRLSRANQFGLLGFGGPEQGRHRPQLELAAGLFLTDALVLGAEYRQRPDTLAAVDEAAAHDLFLAWVPNRRWSLTLARVDLGPVAGVRDQQGNYLSVLVNF